MDDLTIAAIQFENASGDKQANLDTIRGLTKEAHESFPDSLVCHRWRFQIEWPLW